MRWPMEVGEERKWPAEELVVGRNGSLTDGGYEYLTYMDLVFFF